MANLSSIIRRLNPRGVVINTNPHAGFAFTPVGAVVFIFRVTEISESRIFEDGEPRVLE